MLTCKTGPQTRLASPCLLCPDDGLLENVTSTLPLHIYIPTLLSTSAPEQQQNKQTQRNQKPPKKRQPQKPPPPTPPPEPHLTPISDASSPRQKSNRDVSPFLDPFLFLPAWLGKEREGKGREGGGSFRDLGSEDGWLAGLSRLSKLSCLLFPGHGSILLTDQT